MSWDDVNVTSESVEDFYNSIDIDALSHNIDLILDAKNEKKQH